MQSRVCPLNRNLRKTELTPLPLRILPGLSLRPHLNIRLTKLSLDIGQAL